MSVRGERCVVPVPALYPSTGQPWAKWVSAQARCVTASILMMLSLNLALGRARDA
jgi:hypothetical protein